MGTNLYISGLSDTLDDAQLKTMFEAIGPVNTAQVIVDRDTKISKCFGFVDMTSQQDAVKAITEFNGIELNGKKIVVNEARQREDRQSSFGSNFSNRR